jgi:hypothetical protein
VYHESARYRPARRGNAPLEYRRLAIHAALSEVTVEHRPVLSVRR